MFLKRAGRLLIVSVLILIAISPLHPQGSVSAEIISVPPTSLLTATSTYTNLLPVAIPDGTTGTCSPGSPGAAAVSTITVADSVTIVDVNVGLNITHTWVGDLYVTLTSPGGTTIVLVDRPGLTTTGCGYSSDNITTTLDDESAGGPVELGNPPIGTSYTPQNPLSGFDGQNSAGVWTLRVTDYVQMDTGALNSWSLTIARNNPPVAVDDPGYATNEDTALNVPALTGVLANDTDPDGDTLTAALVAGPAHGLFTLHSNGSFDYMPDPEYAGPDSFTYHANDGTVDSNIATVTITVAAVNDPPVAVDDPGYTTPEDTALNVPALTGVLANDTDAEGNTLTAALVAGPANGTLTVNSDGSFDYTPDLDYTGPDSFTYHANDGTVDSNIATVTITVGALNDPPVAVDDPGYATPEDTALTVPALTGVLANDTDPDGDTLTAALVAGPTNGTLTVNSDGSFDYTPDLDYTGPDSFTYRANDGTVDSNIATATITVGALNDPPVAVDDAYTIDQDTPLSVPTPGVLANDSDLDGDPLTAINSVPANGVLAFNVDGSFTYVPNAGFIGDDIFTYVANDGTVNSNVATVTITVEAVAPVNTAPVAVDDAYTTDQDTELNVPALTGALANDTDADGDPLTAVRGDDPLHGGLILNADGSFTYFPDPGFVGADTFTYQAFDGNDYSPLATVTIEVLPVILPVGALQAFDDVLATGPVTPIAFTSADLLANDSIPAGADVSIISLGTPLFGTVTKVGDLITYTPLAGFTGEDRFGYTVQLGSGETSDALVWITVWKPVPACRDIGGEPNSIVYALVPGTAVPTSADVFCRVVVENRVFVRPAGEIGVRDLIDLGIIQAVDVFSLDTNGGWYTVFNTEVDVCLAGSGHLYFLSATGQPRAISAPPTWTSGGYTCGTISSAGTVILVP